VPTKRPPLRDFFKALAGEEFQVHVNAVQTIDWGNAAKRLAFVSEVI